jgi:hypothetical protein
MKFPHIQQGEKNKQIKGKQEDKEFAALLYRTASEKQLKMTQDGPVPIKLIQLY